MELILRFFNNYNFYLCLSFFNLSLREDSAPFNMAVSCFIERIRCAVIEKKTELHTTNTKTGVKKYTSSLSQSKKII